MAKETAGDFEAASGTMAPEKILAKLIKAARTFSEQDQIPLAEAIEKFKKDWSQHLTLPEED